MGSTGRFTDQQVVNSFNLFIDTEKSSILGDGNSKGDDINIHLEGSTIVANDGEMIKLTLTNFEMFNNLYHIDANNSRFQTRCGTDPIIIPNPVPRDLTRQNYATLGDIAIDFANIIGNVIDVATTPAHKVLVVDMKNVVQQGFLPYNTKDGKNYNIGTLTVTSPATFNKPTPLGIGATSNRLLDVTFQTIQGDLGVAHPHLITKMNIECLGSDGDCYAILGGIRNDKSTSAFNSLEIDLNPDNLATPADSTKIRVRGYFPMQRTTDPYVYLRCASSQNGGLEMAILNDSALTQASNNSDITTSNIIAKLKRDVEFITYDSGMGDEYFINLQQRKLSSLTLSLTDSKNRKLGRIRSDTIGTAAGYMYENEDDKLVGRQYITPTTVGFVSKEQSTLGNLFFTAVIRVDIIKTGNPTRLETPALPLPLPARKAQIGVLSVQNFGMPKNGV